VIYNEYELAGHSASIYGSTGSRATRPRQMLMPAAPPPPPPPPPPETEAKKKARKQKTRGERLGSGSPTRLNGHGTNGHAVNGGGMNGYAMNGHSPIAHETGHRMNGQMTDGHEMNGHRMNGHAVNGLPQRSASAMNMASRQERSPRGERQGSQGPAPRPTNQAVRSSSSPRQRAPRGSRAPRGPPPAHMYPPQLVYGTLPPPPHMQMVPLPPMIPGYGPAVMTLPYPGRPGSRAVEEPTYLPSARPLSPTASYQPGQFPHEAYLLQQQYATVDRRRKPRRKQRKEATESPPNTGIYKRRNHLNEKAFGFSIQQEHRSRSYGSLANLETGGGEGRPASREGARKSREMIQMMHELELSADELERSEVRPGLYRGPDSVSQLSHHSQHSGFRRL